MLCALTALSVVCMPATALAKKGTKLGVTLANGYSWEHYDLSPVLNATLKKSAGGAMKGVYVSLYYNGVKKASKKTSSTGAASFNLNLPGTDYHGQWQVKYAGNATYRPSASAKKRTNRHFHFEADELVPAYYDYDGDSANEYVVNIRLKLYAGEVYSLYSEASTLRMISGDADPSTEVYPGMYAEQLGSFTAPLTDYYDIWMECGSGSTMTVWLW